MGKDSLLSYNRFRESSAWIILILGMLLYYISYFHIEQPSVWKEILIKIGDVLVIGVILGYLSNAAQFLGIFKQDLQDIVYGKEFLAKRNDIDSLWETVTKILFKSKFPAINKDLLSLIQKTYLPVYNITYYNDYNSSIKIEWADKNRKIIVVRNHITFELIAETTKRFEFPLRSWIDVEGLEEGDYYVNVSNYLVNGNPAQIVSTKDEIKNGCSEFELVIALEGETKYEISKLIEKKYSIEKDFTICFRALFIISKFTLNFTCPDDINSKFYSRGTVNEFKPFGENKSNSFTRKHKGLILPNQGYVIALKEI